MAKRGICGKKTSDGAPCRNPPGCRVQHSAASSAVHDTAQARAAAAAQANRETGDDSDAGSEPATAAVARWEKGMGSAYWAYAEAGPPVACVYKLSSGWWREDKLDITARTLTIAKAKVAAAFSESVDAAEDRTENQPAEVRIEDQSFRRRSVSVPEEAWREWSEARRDLRGDSREDRIGSDALEVINRSDDVIRRLASEQAEWLNGSGLNGADVDAFADRWANASIALRDAAVGPRPASTAKIEFDHGFWPRTDDDTRLRDPSGANCELKSEDGNRTFDIEGLFEGKVALSLLRRGSIWSHDPDVEVAWYLSEDEARLLVSELGQRFGWD